MLPGALFGEGEPIDAVAAAWSRRFSDHQADALTEVINLALRAAGCHYQLETWAIEDPDNAPDRVTEAQDDCLKVHYCPPSHPPVLIFRSIPEPNILSSQRRRALRTSSGHLSASSKHLLLRSQRVEPYTVKMISWQTSKSGSPPCPQEAAVLSDTPLQSLRSR